MTQEPPSPVEGKTFTEWLSDILPKIAEAQTMLEEPLSHDHSDLSAQATMAEDAYAGMSDVLAQAEAWLDWQEYVEIMGIDRDLTVPERNIILKIRVQKQRMFRDKVKGIAESLKSRMRRAAWLR